MRNHLFIIKWKIIKYIDKQINKDYEHVKNKIQSS